MRADAPDAPATHPGWHLASVLPTGRLPCHLEPSTQRRHVLAAGAALLSSPAIVGAQPGWPSRGPIQLVAPFPPGGLVDVVSRLMAPHLSQALGQSVVVEHRPGAGGLIGTDHVARQAADGYTLLVSHAAVHVYATATRRTMSFDAVGDFTHMGLLGWAR